MYVAGMLLFGSLNTITMKIQFSMSSVGVAGMEEQFQKPWFGTFNMFLGMTLVLFAEALVQIYRRRKVKDDTLSTALVADCSPVDAIDGPLDKEGLSWCQKVCLVAIPAGFDLLATGLCCIGMLYIPASVWQMLRGAEIIFAAILSVLFLKRSMLAFNLLGIALCVIGVTFVGLANVWGSSSEPSSSNNDTGLVVFGMALVLGGQVVQAAQVIAEEWLLKDVDLPEMQIIGFEGM